MNYIKQFKSWKLTIKVVTEARANGEEGFGFNGTGLSLQKIEKTAVNMLSTELHTKQLRW